VPYTALQVRGKAVYVEALSVSGGGGSQFRRKSTHKSGKVVSLLYYQELFLLEAEPATWPQCGWKDYTMKNSSDTSRIEPAIYRLVEQCLKQLPYSRGHGIK